MQSRKEIVNIKIILTVFIIPVIFFPVCRSIEEKIFINGEKVCGYEKKYVIRKTVDCARAKYGCEKNESIFMDNDGCGCKKPVFCDE
jgi:hypothetical protein